MPEAIEAFVGEEGHRALTEFAHRRGVTVAALLTSVAHWLDEHPDVPDHVEKCIDAIVDRARHIDAERRPRRPAEGDQL